MEIDSMMTAAEHYVEAERFVFKAETYDPQDSESIMTQLSIAAGHRRLAELHSQIFGLVGEGEDIRP